MKFGAPRFLAGSVAAALLTGGWAGAGGNLPVPCATGACGATNAWVSSGSATATQTATLLNVNQQSNQAILNWQSFNIAAGSTVKFNQPTTSASALNRIYQNDPSQIFGNLTANGQIYLINQNGIIFGAHAEVNVNSLTASTLNITDQTYLGGILQTNLLGNNQPVFASDGRTFATDQNGNLVLDPNGQPIPVAVVVQAGAQITTPTTGGGRIMLLGQQVENSGSLSSPAGQVILAAGQTVYLQASDDPALRGIVVAVDGGGPVSNLPGGQISSSTGNVTLLGLAVNQDGRISATTSVNENGSIKLLAEDSHTISADTLKNLVLNDTETGTLELGPQSVTSVLPETGSTATAVETALPNPSTIQMIGHQIHLDGGSTVVAPSGQVSLEATLNPSTVGNGSVIPPDPGSQIRIDPGASIDVSGSEVTLPMSSNIISVQLRGNELRNDPQQRSGVLEGQTVYIDTRADNGQGTTIADVSGEIGDIAYGVGQLTTAGGSISVLSDGDAVLAQGAKLNVSGGNVTYTGGVIATTQLTTADGHVYDIGSADPNLTYTGVINPTMSTTNTKWGVITNFSTFTGNAHYEPGYIEGASAGSVQIGARSLVINGTLLGSAIAGPLQRTSSTQPLGGQLIIGNPNASKTDFDAPYVDFSANVLPIAVAPGTPLVGLLDTLDLPTSFLTTGGFTRTTVYSNGEIVVPAGLSLNLAPNSTFNLTAPEIDLASSITAPGGSIKLSAVPVGAALDFPGRGGIQIGDGVTLDVSGRWVNDAPEFAGANPTDPITLNGGSVGINMSTPGGALIVGNDVGIDVSAGAYASAGGATSYGKAGSIVLAAPAPNSEIQIGQGLVLTGYGVDASPGGSLTFVANRIVVVHDDQPWAAQSVDFNDPNAQSFNLSDSLFAQGGFATYTIAANGPQILTANQAIVAPLVIGANANIDSLVATRMLPADVLFQEQTGTTLASFAPVQLPLSYQRLAANLSFGVYSGAAGTAALAGGVSSSNEGDLVIDAGAAICADPGSVFSVTAPTNIRIGGTLHAPAGTISLNLSSPSPLLDIGYSPTQGIYLESGSLLDVSGTTVLSPSAVGLATGQVLPGGSVSIIAYRGSIFGQAGSAIDVSGTHATLNIPTGNSPANGATAENVTSAGGSVTLIAPESITLDTTLSAQSGAASGTAGPAGGSLTIALSRNEGFVPPLPDANVPPFPTTPRTIVVGPNSSQGTSGVAVVNQATIDNGGFSAVTLAADDLIELMAGTSLSLNQSIALQAPNLASVGTGSVSLRAPIVALGPANIATQSANAAALGSSVLSVQAGLIQLNGNVALQGFDQTSLTASSDLQAVGVLDGQQLTGSFSSAGTLTLAAREIYPTTLSQFTVAVPNGTIDTRSTGSAEPVLSAGGSLTLSAAQIDHAGTIEAPFGQVSLDAGQSLQLEPGSTVSVSGNGQTIPFGETQNGTAWVYNLVPGPTETPNQLLSVLAPPGKQITLAAPSVHVAAGATVDDSGGGDLFAFEFVPGLGGSSDALSVANSPTTYAILPQMHTYAPLDPEYSSGSTLQAGAAVYLSGVPGELAAGTYTLLPARYALLPGAFLITEVSGQQDLLPGQMATAANGAPIVSGYLTTTGTTIRDSRTSGFEIEPGSYAHQLAEYDITSANAFFPAQAAANGTPVPQIPLDAGALAFTVVDSLLLDGTINTKPAAGGRGATVDLSAENLEIVSVISGNGGSGAQVSASSLEALGAQSVLIGGTRSTAPDGSTLVTVTAQDVSLAADTSLSAPEVLLAGQNQVLVGAGAQLTATGTSSTLGGGTLNLDSSSGSTALVRVSGGGQVAVVNSAPNAASGSVDIAQGSVLSAMGSITVSSTHDTQSQGQLDANQGSLSLAASRISLGDGAQTTQGLVISDAELAQFGKLTQLILTSQTSIDLYNGAALGSLSAQGTASLGSLVLDAGAIRGFGASGTDSQLAAGAIRLTNSGPNTAPAPGTGSGNLQIEGASLELDAGSYGFSGFQNVTLASQGDLIANGAAAITAQSNLTLQGTRIIGNSGADLSIDAAGYAVQTRAATVNPKLAVTTPGAGVILAVNADTIDHGGIFVLPSGQLTLEATNAVSLDNGSIIDVAGAAQTFGNITVGTPGGTVVIKSDQGNVSMASGARVDVSGSAAGGDAGTLEIDAAGMASMAGTLLAQSQNGSAGGSFTLDAGQIGNFAPLSNALNVAGFSQQQDITVGSGDLTLPAGGQMIAHNVALTANGGSLTIDGDINARGAAGGTVQLNASGNVTLGASGSIEVDASGASAIGGTVEFNTSQGSIATASGSSISAAGSGGTGAVIFRAPAIGNDVAITALDGNISGAGSVIARVVQVYDNVSTVDDAMQATVESNLANFSSTAAAIMQRLGQVNNPVFGVEAGVELRSTGDMVVSDPWDLFSFRPNGLPGELTLRAAGNLEINATISDGLESSGGRLEPQAGPSWSYRLTGGADLGSANPDAVVSLANVAAGGGDVVIGSGVSVRTGTGTIRVDAGQDIVFQDQTSVLYTSGVPVASMPPVNYANLKNSALNWTSGGGDIDLFAGRDVVGAASNQIVTSWQLREVNSLSPTGPETMWGTDFGQFQENVGALGGGNVNVIAGRDVLNFSAAIPTTGTADQGTGAEQIWGGGDLAVTAGRDLAGGVYYVGQGVGTISAGRSITTGGAASSPFGTVLALGDGSFNVTAGNTLELDTVLNPTVIGQPITNQPARTYFFTYAPTSSVNLLALSGNLSLLNDHATFLSVVGSLIGKNTTTGSVEPDNWYPGEVSAVALGGDVDVLNSMLLFPSPVGKIDLLAANTVTLSTGGINVGIDQPDVQPALVPSPVLPAKSPIAELSALLFADEPSSQHNNDSTPSVIIAQLGDILGGSLNFSEPADLIAGRDIVNVNLTTENFQPGDVTLLQAARDITYANDTNAADQISVGGPGTLEMLAGRNIDLGSSAGVTTVGSTVNQGLPGTTGATVIMLAGLGQQPDYQGFITQYLADENTYSSQLTQFMQTLTGNTMLSGATALADFEHLSSAQQLPLISAVFFDELNQAGLEATANQKPGYVRGFDAINTLFPGSLTAAGTTTPAANLPYGGNLELDFSRIYTLAGGDIDLYVPGGLLNVGLANPPVNAPFRTASQLGIVAQSTGSIDAFTYGDVLVNQSRIFTLDGGNIVIWSSTGNIDAGRGAKSAISAPPPVLVVNPDGSVTIDFAGAVTGSGIRTILTEPGVVPGNVDLIAPVGIVNASDAGIGSAGNLNIAAATVLGANNINVGGTASGVPSPTNSLAAGLTGVSNSATSASKDTVSDVSNAASAEKTAPVAESALSWLDVFVTGLGEENCKPDDIDCLARQKK